MQHFISDQHRDIVSSDNNLSNKPSLSTFQMALRQLLKNPIFYISSFLILLILTVIFAPGLFTSADPTYGDLRKALAAPEPGHPLGFDSQGYDLLARVVYGAQPSVTIGLLTTIIATLLGVIVGALAGYFGGILDTVLSRVTDIFYAVPLILGAVVVLTVLKEYDGIWKMVLVLSMFSWVTAARMMRGKVLETKNQEFITSARALGQSKFQILLSHVAPNSVGPAVVTATISLGSAIVAESSLTFLGLGLGGSTPSWGHDITYAKDYLSSAPQLLLWPSLALAATVLAFILLGDAINEALDTKGRK